MNISEIYVKIYPHEDIPQPLGCVSLNPEKTSWQYEAWDGSGRVVDLYQSPTDAIQGLLDYFVSK